MGTGFFLLGSFVKDKATFEQDENVASGSLKTSDSVSPSLQALSGENREGGMRGVNQGLTDDGTLTESVSRELLASLILKGKRIEKTDVERELRVLFEKAARYETPNIYTEKNISTVSDTAENFKFHGNAVMAAIVEHSDASAENVLDPFEKLLEGDESAQKTIFAAAAEYRKLESDILSIKTPARIAPLHLDFANTLHSIGNAALDVAAIEDPFRGVLGLSVYLKELERARKILIEINNIFESQNIAFEKNEAGYAWRGFE